MKFIKSPEYFHQDLDKIFHYICDRAPIDSFTIAGSFAAQHFLEKGEYFSNDIDIFIHSLATKSMLCQKFGGYESEVAVNIRIPGIDKRVQLIPLNARSTPEEVISRFDLPYSRCALTKKGNTWDFLVDSSLNDLNLGILGTGDIQFKSDDKLIFLIARIFKYSEKFDKSHEELFKNSTTIINSWACKHPELLGVSNYDLRKAFDRVFARIVNEDNYEEASILREILSITSPSTYHTFGSASTTTYTFADGGVTLL